MTEILSISKAQNKEEAESKYRQVMNKINQTTQDVDTMNKLISFAQMVFNAVNNLF